MTKVWVGRRLNKKSRTFDSVVYPDQNSGEGGSISGEAALSTKLIFVFLSLYFQFRSIFLGSRGFKLPAPYDTPMIRRNRSEMEKKQKGAEERRNKRPC